ncbi:MAG TPA: 4-hydroxy-3-methylbut-2-enyl diphosphate reductase [Solirubrobacteraceae bacterium]|nr:4-hydroxy-3-methylbut-2-enyl diphosphate reductase [Solirubrobacteraceae bacterium]
MRIEAWALRRGAPQADVRHIGMGPRRASRQAASLRLTAPRPTVLAGFCGALHPDLRPGDVVLATEIHGPSGVTPCTDPSVLAGALRRRGLRVHVGPMASTRRVVMGRRGRQRLSTGALAVDMESAWVVPALADRSPVVMRVVMDTPSQELYRPVRAPGALIAACRSLTRAAQAAEEWARAVGRREIVLAAPRASCAGVLRAIETVRAALRERGAPIYVRKQIVHNAHVVADLERQGARFVNELDDVPPGATVVFSAHGVSPEVRAEAVARSLDVIDATCPLVSKVHAEARRYAADGFDIVLVGHAGHEEVEGTLGEAPGRIQLIAGPDQVGEVRVRNPEKVAYLTQTTLAVDDTAAVLEALHERFPGVARPATSDICYATQNRQDAVRSLAEDCQIILVLGSANSSNSRRLVEVAERAGCPARLIDGAADIPLECLSGVERVGITAGASAPEELVQDVVRALQGLGGATISERRVATEDIHFKLPAELRARGSAQPARKEVT